jgi:hypothetical protein
MDAWYENLPRDGKKVFCGSRAGKLELRQKSLGDGREAPSDPGGPPMGYSWHTVADTQPEISSVSLWCGPAKAATKNHSRERARAIVQEKWLHNMDVGRRAKSRWNRPEFSWSRTL